MTVLITLNSNFKGQKLTVFLDKCRDWRMTIPTQNKKYLKMAFISKPGVPYYENVVTATSASLQICGLHLHKTHELMMVTPRMATTKTKQVYGPSNIACEDGHFSVPRDGTHPCFQLEVEASTQLNLPLFYDNKPSKIFPLYPPK